MIEGAERKVQEKVRLAIVLTPLPSVLDAFIGVVVACSAQTISLNKSKAHLSL